MQWIDLSHPLSDKTPPFPGDPPVEISILDATQEVDDRPREHLNCSRLAISVHCGTHMDAPFHFFGNGTPIDQVNLQTCVGDALLINLEGQLDSGPSALIDAELLATHQAQISRVSRILLGTGWYRRWHQAEYFTEHPVLTRSAAHYLVERGVRLVGVDFPSVDRPPHEAHLELLGNGVVIVENLTGLDKLPAALFELLCIPLAIHGRDGSPVRAIARIGGS